MARQLYGAPDDLHLVRAESGDHVDAELRRLRIVVEMLTAAIGALVDAVDGDPDADPRLAEQHRRRAVERARQLVACAANEAIELH